MYKYDVETLMTAVKSILTTNLNAAIAAVEAEKIAQGAPTTGLLPIDTTNGYFEQSWSDKILNITPAIFYGIEDIKANGIGPATEEICKLFVEVVLIDNGMDTLAKYRIHRYARAIKDVFEANYDRFPGKIKIETVRPVSFKLDLNSSEEIKVGGVSLTTAIA